MRLFRFSALVAALCLVGWQAQRVQAAPIPWSNPNGTTPGGVIWSNGQNETNLMGSPTPIGNTFFFVPQGFVAESSNGQGLSSGSDPAVPGNPIGKAHDRVDVDLTAPAGFKIQAINIFEAGDYAFLGNGQVQASGSIIVTPTAPTVLPSVSDIIHTTPGFPASPPPNSANWTGVASVSLGAANATSVHFSWDNNLIAVTGVGPNDARIEKKAAFSNVIIQIIIPEPGTLGILLCGAPMLLRRKRSH